MAACQREPSCHKPEHGTTIHDETLLNKYYFLTRICALAMQIIYAGSNNYCNE
ncbi:hypothetical protein L798_13278 [Zootermopsis nevadensis]|uniref:Uncharacterized protein n=1 Tax=Zootermopsis nevadensis TaxID=136037 RepID=A0A067R4V7_ZOONE|nr:hypothetical protein L798_13278 [Zootermopsis nevadensis]